MATLVDASTILALTSIGELDLLKKMFGKIHITAEVKKEILIKDAPTKEPIRKAIGKWVIVKRGGRAAGKGTPPGLGLGERSLFSRYKEGDILVIDDLLARRTARALGYQFTGLLGLLVAGVEERVIGKDTAMDILERLASSNFHMSASLFLEVSRRSRGR